MKAKYLACMLILFFAAQDAWADPSRMVTLGAGVTETVFALGMGDNVVGVDVSSMYPPEAFKKPKVGYVRQTSAEGIASLKPDLVLASEILGPPAIRDQLKAAGLKLELVPAAKSIEDAVTRIKTVGRLLNKSAAAEVLAQSVNEKVKAAAEHAKGRAPARVLFIFVHGGTSMQVSGTSTAANAMIEAAGAQNAVNEFKGYKALSAEALLAANPDVVLATTRSLKAIGGADGVWASPGISATKAGKAKALIVMDDLRLMGFGPRTGEALLELTRAIYK